MCLLLAYQSGDSFCECMFQPIHLFYLPAKIVKKYKVLHKSVDYISLGLPIGQFLQVLTVPNQYRQPPSHHILQPIK